MVLKRLHTEIFGLAYKDGAFYVTQSCELTRVTDTERDGKANRFETISDAWGYANYHEYAFGSKFDQDGNLHIALGLSNSYDSYALLRGFVLKVSPNGKTKALASGLRSPGGIGHNEHGALFSIESQGPWNCSSATLVLDKLIRGHVYDFDLGALRSRDMDELLHRNAYYTVNEVPKAK